MPKETDEDRDLGYAIIHMLLSPGLIALNIFLDAIVSRKLWAWFIVEEFGVSPLGWYGAVGIGLLATHWTHQHTKTVKESSLDVLSRHIATAVFAPLIVLLIGWLARLAIGASL